MKAERERNNLIKKGAAELLIFTVCTIRLQFEIRSAAKPAYNGVPKDLDIVSF
jgi:hypothetical protein